MIRRTFSSVALACCLALTTAVATHAADEKGHDHKAMNECARACADCMRECEACAHHCGHLIAEGKKEHLKTLGTCADCAEFCAMAAKIVSHRGPMTAPACEACAKACDVCGAACEKHPEDDHMKKCAKACRDCATACRDMLKHVSAEK